MYVVHILGSSDALFFFFFFNDTATTEIYTLSLHDALPISRGDRPLVPALSGRGVRAGGDARPVRGAGAGARQVRRDRKSTRLNSSHGYISYAGFCLKKKKTQQETSRCIYDATHSLRHNCYR